MPEFDHIGAAAPTLKAASASPPAGRTNWDGVFTDAQARRGQQVYQRACSVCHLDELQGDAVSPPLVGAVVHRTVRRIDARSRWCRASGSSMPQNAPDSLGDRAYIDLVSYLLKMNGSAAGATELPIDVAELEVNRDHRSH